MPSTEFTVSAEVVLSSAECETLQQNSKLSIAELGAEVLALTQAECSLITSYNHHGNYDSSGKRVGKNACQMSLKVIDLEDGETSLTFACNKMLCRGEDSPLEAADRLIRGVTSPVQIQS